VSLIGPAGTHVEEALLDTGSDDVVFPEDAAAKIGLDLSNAPTLSAGGIATHATTCRFAHARLRVTDGVEFREWTAMVGFAPTPMRQPILGYAGFLQFFTATFHGDLEQVELAVNPTYPGT
jgi:hypothetical protein